MARIEDKQWSGTPAIKGLTEPLRMLLLTVSMVGFSVTWGFETTYGTPYLLQLGLSKSLTSAVWIAGPLSGLIMQPLVGVFADNSTSRWGRRRPYMFGGMVFSLLSLAVLGWPAEIVGTVIKDEDTKKFWTVFVAVGSIYVLDFSLNVVMAAARTLVVDMLPTAKQQLGSAWAARMGAVGHLIGFALGAIDLRSMWGDWLGNSQFKQLTVISAVILLGTCSLTAWAVTERVLLSTGGEGKKQTALHLIAKLFKTAFRLPPRIQAVCWSVFWSWIAWFFFLFYGSTWVGEIYYRYDDPEGLMKSEDRLGAIGRVGSFALILFAVVFATASVFLPFVIAAPDAEKKTFTSRPPAAVAFIFTFLQERAPDLLTSWMCGHLFFAAMLMCTPFVRTAWLATAIIAAGGIPWSFTMWAPFAFVGIESNRLASGAPNGAAYHRVSDTEDVDGDVREPLSSTTIRLDHQGLLGPEDGVSGTMGAMAHDAEPSTGEMAGIYMGILNFYTSAPQLVGTFIGMIVFAIVEPGKSEELAGSEQHQQRRSMELVARHGGGMSSRVGVNGIAVCMFIGGLSALGAAYAAYRLRRVR